TPSIAYRNLPCPRFWYFFSIDRVSVSFDLLITNERAMSRFSLSHRGYVYLCLTFSTLNLCNAWINWQYCNKHKRVAMEN
ncbi:unnamed protein product, partial [Linum tenue]